MKRIIRSSIVLLAVALGTNALATGFTAGNLVIYRLGGNASGAASGALTNAGTVIWLDEYSTAGAFVRSHMMPTNYFGADSPMIGNGTAFGSGLITRSVDGRFIQVNGYGETLGTLSNSVSTTFATEAPRIVGLVDGNGNIDTTTAVTNSLSNGEDLRSSVSTDGTNLWFGGDSSGVRYILRGGSLPTTVTVSPNNIRQINIANNQLYLSTINIGELYIVTNNVPNTLPTVTNNVGATFLAGVTNLPSPWAFAFFNITGGANPDTLYVADATAFAVVKFSTLNGGVTWNNNGSILAGGAVGLTGRTRVVGTTTNVDLWMTGGGATLT